MDDGVDAGTRRLQVGETPHVDVLVLLVSGDGIDRANVGEPQPIAPAPLLT